MNRVAVTGLGAICGLGHNLEEVWANALAGKSGISKVSYPPPEELSVQIAGEVKDFELSPSILPPKEAKRYDRFLHMALAAGVEAFHHAGLGTENGGVRRWPLPSLSHGGHFRSGNGGLSGN